MTVSKGNRVGLTRWSSDLDDWDREDWDADNALLEDVLALDLQVPTLANRPAPGVDGNAQPADTRGRYCYVEATGKLYRDTGAAWVLLNPDAPERYSYVFQPGTSTVLPVGWHPAGKSASSYTDADDGAAAAFPSWLTVTTDAASADAGLLELAAGDYIVSLTMRLADSAQDVPYPDGSLWTMGATLTNSPALLGTPRDIAPPLTMSAAVRALGAGHTFTRTLATDGLRYLKPFVYIGAAAGTVRQFTFRVDVTKLA